MSRKGTEIVCLTRQMSIIRMSGETETDMARTAYDTTASWKTCTNSKVNGSNSNGNGKVKVVQVEP